MSYRDLISVKLCRKANKKYSQFYPVNFRQERLTFNQEELHCQISNFFSVLLGITKTGYTHWQNRLSCRPAVRWQPVSSDNLLSANHLTVCWQLTVWWQRMSNDSQIKPISWPSSVYEQYMTSWQSYVRRNPNIITYQASLTRQASSDSWPFLDSHRSPDRRAFLDCHIFPDRRALTDSYTYIPW
jgi:hypothetical protein